MKAQAEPAPTRSRVRFADEGDAPGGNQLTLSALNVRHLIFHDVYESLKNDHGDALTHHIHDCVDVMDQTPWDPVDKNIYLFKKNSMVSNTGLVDRRGPKNPFHSKKFNKKKYEAREKKAKVEDPGMQNIPLRGRQIVNIATCSLLLFIFFQEQAYAYISSGSIFVEGVDSFTGETLFDLGGLHTNAIRQGEVFRVFWACYMHSGWLHITMNLLCQIQYILMYEPDWGFWRVLCVFFGGALCGNLTSANLDPCMITVGSSGSLFGLMGACVPYCIEYWNSLPRPLLIAIMTVAIMIITILQGFGSSGTDNWAHIGGAVGGMFVGFMGTVNVDKAPTCCARPNPVNAPPKELSRNWFFRLLQSMNAFEGCRCGWREWSLRIFGFTGFASIVTTGFYFLLVDPRFQPIGSMTWDGVVHCCCCIPPFYKPSVWQDRDHNDPNNTNREVVCGRCVSESDPLRLDLGGGNTASFTLFGDPQDLSTWTSNQRNVPCAWIHNPRAGEESWDPWDPDTWVYPASGGTKETSERRSLSDKLKGNTRASAIHTAEAALVAINFPEFSD